MVTHDRGASLLLCARHFPDSATPMPVIGLDQGEASMRNRRYSCVVILVMLTLCGRAVAQSGDDSSGFNEDWIVIEEFDATRLAPFGTNTRTRWLAWHGTQAISQFEFFSLVGDDTALVTVRTNRRRGMWIVGGGATAWLAGLAMGPVGAAFIGHDPSPQLNVVGYASSGLGFIVAMVGLAVANQPVVPVERAIMFADSYNERSK